MFTVGIFTTHFPYIAFVVFYACIFLFGVNTPGNDDIHVDESKFNIEVQTSVSFVDLNSNSNFHYQTDFEFHTNSGFEESVFKRKLNHHSTHISWHWKFCLCNSLFCRPPPTLV